MNQGKPEDLYGDGVAYVRLVDAMGDEWVPAEDARMSTGKGRLGPEKDHGLQERLMKDKHTSPFEGAVLKVEMCVPLFVLRELDRHRTLDKNGESEEIELPEENLRKWFSRNEMSGRYVQLPDQYYHPWKVRVQSLQNKQGTAEAPSISHDVACEFYRRGVALTLMARELYDWAVGQGIEKGLARIYNTQNQYTRIRYTGSVKNWLDFLYLRLPSVVLWECRQVAEAVAVLINDRFKDIYETWRKNVYEAVTLNRDEVRFLNDILRDDTIELDGSKEFDALLMKLKSAR
jgi:thymidylate synthase (FAD)